MTTLNKLGVLAFAAQFAPRLLKVRRGTWIAAGVGLVVLLGLVVWAAVALIGWLIGQASGLFAATREVAAGPVQGVLEQVGRVLPAAQERLGDYLPALGSEPARDVSGEDLGPLPRPAGLVRSAWQREGARAIVEYAGRADYHAVLDHYSRGYAALGYVRNVLSARPGAETHEYAKGAERYRVTVTRQGRGVAVRIESGKS